MANKKSSSTKHAKAVSAKRGRSAPIAEAGIKTSQQFSSMMSAIMSDLIEGAVSPGIANAICNAGGKLLKNVELSQKYGYVSETGLKDMILVMDTTAKDPSQH